MRVPDYGDVLRHLIDSSFVETSQVVDGDVALLDVSRRNFDICVLCGGRPRYFLKHDGGPADGAAADYASVRYEATVYALLKGESTGGATGRCLPEFYGYDAESGFLVLEGLDGESLSTICRRTGQVPPGLASAFGRAVARLHANAPGDHGPVLSRRSSPPWLSLFPIPTRRVFLSVSAAVLAFLKLVSESATLRDRLHALSRDWSPTTMVHGDLRWDNCFATDAGTGPIGSSIRIVDWELAGSGDGAWDLGSFLGEYLNTWLSSVPILSAADPDRFLDAAGAPLLEMQPSIRAFWSAYASDADGAVESTDALLLRSCSNMGARLIQLACEELQDEIRLTGKAVVQLQLAENILLRPEEAAVRLLGIPLREPWRETKHVLP